MNDTKTTTKHAELIERLEAEHRRLIEVAAGIEKHDESNDMEAAIRAHNIATTGMLLKDATTALRTSYRDGWLGAADELARYADTPEGLSDFYLHPYFHDAADHLRRNARHIQELDHDNERNAGHRHAARRGGGVD